MLRIIRKTADGWWLAQDAEGNRGVVPKTYLKVTPPAESLHHRGSRSLAPVDLYKQNII